jgi:hypothetical protein
MNYKEEFATVELLMRSNFETRAVDSFAISLMKVERQIRKLFTFLIFQHENYQLGDGAKLREVLTKNKEMYFQNFIKGIDLICIKTVEQVYGDDYTNDFKLIKLVTLDRNKIFHGQVTSSILSREELTERVELMKKWCKTLANRFSKEIGYDGFGRNSYHKSDSKLPMKNLDKFDTLEKYANFLADIDRKR